LEPAWRDWGKLQNTSVRINIFSLKFTDNYSNQNGNSP
jgi:hypothetical protein